MEKKNRTANSARMTSIVRKIHWQWIWKKLGMNLGFDLVLFLLLSAGWAVTTEYAALGRLIFRKGVKRALFGVHGLRHMTYRIIESDGNVLLKTDAFYPMLVICGIVIAFLILQLMGMILSYYKEDRQIRKALAPINEIALKADEISRSMISGDQYQRIEEAIAHLEPEEAEMKLSFGDEDLTGIETAVNNLIYRMRDAYRQQARFVNDASHELRTPISVIRGYANMLRRWGSSDPEVLNEAITAIDHESEHMQHLVEQLLFLARGDSGRTKLSFEEVDLKSMMQEVYEESLMIDEAHIYRLRLPEEPLSIKGDPGMLKQAVRILADNAAKYTNEGDEIILSAGTAEYDGKIQTFLQVQDAGIGMAEADVAHMFERFYRADEARSYDGTGLGLSIAKWIIDRHDGRFEILSRTELGTRIRILLPDSAE